MASRHLSKKEFCRFCRLLYNRHLVTGIGGNVASRAGEGIYLTPSGYSLRDIKPHLVVTVDDHGEVLEGGMPTTEAKMHLKLLQMKAHFNAVCHVHGAHIVAATTLLRPGPDSLPPLTPGFVFLAHPLPMIPFFVPGSERLSQNVSKAFSQTDTPALLLQNHGLVTLGRDLQEALNVAEEVEEAAKVFVLTRGKARAIPSEHLAEIGRRR